MALKKRQEQEYAKILFINQNLTQKEIAARVGVTEKTLGKWIEDEGWEKLKRSLLVTKKSQLGKMYDQLEWINNEIATRKPVYDVPSYLLKPTKIKNEKTGEFDLIYPTYDPSDYPVKIGNVATSKEADAIAKLTAAIGKLENETSIGHIVEVAQEFIEFSREVDFDFAKMVTNLFDQFINSKMK